MKDIQAKLKEAFNVTHEHQSQDTLPALYRKLITEEYEEFLAEKDNTPEQFKELCDLLWVCIQFANSLGYDLEAGMNALINEYSSKFFTAEGEFDPIYREDGKLKKNTGFKKADFTKLMRTRKNDK